jgi:hypothetical protein
MDSDDHEKHRFVARALTAKHSVGLLLPVNLAAVALIAVIAILAWKFPDVMEEGWPVPVIAVLILGLGAATIPVTNRARKKELLICVTPDGVTVDKRPNDVFSFGDIQLGKWTRRGAPATVALHLRSGGRRFVVGRSDLSAGRLTPELLPVAPPVGWAQPDAVMSLPDFDELAALIVRRRESGLPGGSFAG